MSTQVQTTADRVSKTAGFTLVEMMVVTLVLAVLITLVVPGFQEMISNNRMVTEIYALRATLSNARAEALARRAPVVVCPTSNGTACDSGNTPWQVGYMSFVDTNDDNAPDASNPDEEVIQWESRDRIIDISFDNANDQIRFSAQGTALGSAGTFTLCDSRGAGDARALIITPVGSLRSAVDTDSPEDGIVNDGGNTNVSC